MADLADAIAQNRDLLRTTMRDIAPQHRSVRAVFDTSWRLLAPAEQALLARLSVFRGGFSAAAAAAVAEATPIGPTRLRYQSLIRDAGQGRYDMHEFIRQYAAEKLAALGEIVETDVGDLGLLRSGCRATAPVSRPAIPARPTPVDRR